MRVHFAARGDCIAFLSRLPQGFADCAINDPPYNTANKNVKHLKGRKPLSSDFGAWDYFGDGEYLDFTKRWLTGVRRALKPFGNFLMFSKLEYVSDIRRIYESFGMRHHATIIWHKTNPSPQVRKTGFLSACEAILWAVNGSAEKGIPYTFNFTTQREMHNFIETPICMGRERTAHPTQKPLTVLTHLLKIFSNPGDFVLDCFAGSGTTAAAAMALGRNSVSIENDEAFFAIMQKRLSSDPLAPGESCLFFGNDDADEFIRLVASAAKTRLPNDVTHIQ